MKSKVLLVILCGMFLLGEIPNLREYAEKLCYPAMFYAVGGQTEWDWNEVIVKRILPLYAYMSENTPPEAEVEDSFTYEMILAQQENDEYTMSEDLETVTQQEKPVQPTQNAQTTTVSIDKLRDFNYLLSQLSCKPEPATHGRFGKCA